MCVVEFLRAWVLLLEHIEAAALCTNVEVSLAALKSFQEVLLIGSIRNNTKTDTLAKPATAATPVSTNFSSVGAYFTLYITAKGAHVCFVVT